MRRWSWSMTMLPNKVLGKYDWNVDGKTGIGAAWVVAAFILPILVWAIFMLSRMQGWRRVVNIFACLTVCAILSVPASLLIAFTLRDLLK